MDSGCVEGLHIFAFLRVIAEPPALKIMRVPDGPGLASLYAQCEEHSGFVMLQGLDGDTVQPR